MNEGHYVIPSFSPKWWIATSISALIIYLFLWHTKRLDKDKRRVYEIMLSGISLFVIFYNMAHDSYMGYWNAAKSLPLHLCGISKVVGAILILRFNQRWFEFALLLGMGGALQAFLTPEVTTGNSLWAQIEYYISHGAIILIPLYIFYVQERRLTQKAWLRAFLLGLVVLAIVGIFNHFVNGNYIYLCEKPKADNPLLIGEWPYYLTGFLVFGFINIILFHFLFRWWGKRLDRA